MTLRWSRTFKTLVGITAVSVVGVLGCGFFSSRGNLWERVTIGFALGMTGSMISTLGLALLYYLTLRLGLSRRYLRRETLTDLEFIALSPALKGVDPMLVNLVRRAAARKFRSIGGERFHPGDDLETDLHLHDLCFWGEWLESVTDDLGIEEDALARELEPKPINTYGDLILLFDRLKRQTKSAKFPSENGRPHPFWDRELDG